MSSVDRGENCPSRPVPKESVAATRDFIRMLAKVVARRIVAKKGDNTRRSR